MLILAVIFFLLWYINEAGRRQSAPVEYKVQAVAGPLLLLCWLGTGAVWLVRFLL